jgi:hypothetical protein
MVFVYERFVLNYVCFELLFLFLDWIYFGHLMFIISFIYLIFIVFLSVATFGLNFFDDFHVESEKCTKICREGNCFYKDCNNGPECPGGACSFANCIKPTCRGILILFFFPLQISFSCIFRWAMCF